jgi:hypothetical protein
MAIWALGRLENCANDNELKALYAGETDPDVRAEWQRLGY